MILIIIHIRILITGLPLVFVLVDDCGERKNTAVKGRPQEGYYHCSLATDEKVPPAHPRLSRVGDCWIGKAWGGENLG